MSIKSLYGGDIQLRFSEGTHRYDVSTDGGKVWAIKKGVTTVLGATLNKPALMLWPLNEALKSLGARSVCTDQEKQTWEWVLENDVVVNTIKIQAAATAHRKKSDKGKDVGHAVHAMVEQFLRFPDETVPFDIKTPEGKSFNAFATWFGSLPSVKILGVEQIVYSRQNDVCGTFDCLLEIDGKVVLCDLKSTNASRDAPQGVYPEMYLQLGAYAQAYLEESPEAVIDDLAIINAGKTGGLNVVFASELGLSVQACVAGWLRVLNTYKFLQPLAKQIKERGR